MGVVGTIVRVFCTVVVPFLIISLALILGWLNLGLPEGRFFATVVPLTGGKMPPLIVGHGKMTGTPPVPDDMLPEPVPEHASFIELAGGYPMPKNGIGMCCRPTAYDDVLVERTVLWYLLVGGRLIDTAQLYLNHEAIGRGIKEAIRRGIPREEIFVTTKVSPGLFGYNSTKEIVPTFLKELDLEYLDLVILHAPARFPIPGITYVSSECSRLKLSVSECRKASFRALSELRDEGIIRSAGVSNFAVHHMKELQEMENAAPVAVNQIQFNPWVDEEWMEAYQYCQENNIAVTGYFSLGGSFELHKAQTLETLNNIAQKHGKTVPQILLRWALQVNVAIIPGTGNPKHMRENLSVYEFELSQEEVDAITNLRYEDSAKAFGNTGLKIKHVE